MIFYNLEQNLDKAPLFSRNELFCLKNWKRWRTPTMYIFCWYFAHRSQLPISTKMCLGFFKFYVDLKLFANVKKDVVSTHSQKPFLLFY